MSLRVSSHLNRKSTLRQLACSLLPSAPETSPRTTSHLWPLPRRRRERRAQTQTRKPPSAAGKSRLCATNTCQTAARSFPAGARRWPLWSPAPAPKDPQQGPVPPSTWQGPAKEASLPILPKKPLEASYHWWGMHANAADTWDRRSPP